MVFYNYLKMKKIVEQLLFFAGPGDLLGRFYGAWGIRVGGQLVTMGMGMGRMFFWENGLFDRFVFRVRLWTGNRMVPCILQLAFPILAGSCLDRNIHSALFFWRGFSWRHNE